MIGRIDQDPAQDDRQREHRHDGIENGDRQGAGAKIPRDLARIGEQKMGERFRGEQIGDDYHEQGPKHGQGDFP